MKAPFLLGRLIFGGFFLYNGINHFQHRKELAEYAAAKKVPAPEAAVVVSGAAMAVGGASILLGVKPKVGTLAVLGFLSSVSPVMHNFWADEDPKMRESNLINFAKNMAMAGAALALLGVEEPWEASVPIAQPKGLKLVRAMGRILRAA